jgi:hypothetical protein
MQKISKISEMSSSDPEAAATLSLGLEDTGLSYSNFDFMGWEDHMRLKL